MRNVEALNQGLMPDEPEVLELLALMLLIESRRAARAGPDSALVLLAIAPSPVVALNRAVAVAEVAGPAAALAQVEGLDLGGYYLFHAIRADRLRLRRLGRAGEAGLAYEAALARTENAAERAFLQRRLEALGRA